MTKQIELLPSADQRLVREVLRIRLRFFQEADELRRNIEGGAIPMRTPAAKRAMRDLCFVLFSTDRDIQFLNRSIAQSNRRERERQHKNRSNP